MYKVVVATSGRVRFLGCAYLYFAVPLRNTVYVTTLTYTYYLWFCLVVCFAHLIEHTYRILLDELVEHVFHLGRGIFHMTDNKAVQTYLMYELQPRHVYLRGGTTSPLTCFQKDKTDWLTFQPATLKAHYQLALWSIHTKMYVFTTSFLLDENVHCCPKCKVVLRSNANKLLYYLFLIFIGILHIQVVFQKFADATCFYHLLHKWHL